MRDLVFNYNHITTSFLNYLSVSSFKVRDYCTEDVMRLYGGTSSTNGVLQICREGVWGNIASYAWSTYEAELACRQLGLPTECEL